MLGCKRYAKQLGAGLVLVLLVAAGKSGFDPDASLSKTLQSWGATPPSHFIGDPDPEQVAIGRQLVNQGYTTKIGRKSKRISKYFVCTDCHNLDKEFFAIGSPNPVGRFEVAQSEGRDYLPGSSFYGMVNQPSWYNGDYEKKYGSLVVPARNNLREAIQLCADECSQGRRLEVWEEEAILHYLWTLELKLSDLLIPPKIQSKLEKASPKEKLELIASYLPKGNGATFATSAYFSKEELVGTPTDQGKYIYEHGCQTCHSPSGSAKFKLHNPTGKQILKKHLYDFTSDYNLFNATRYGTHPIPGEKAYMPQYTLEKMSDDQLKSLVAFILETE